MKSKYIRPIVEIMGVINDATLAANSIDQSGREVGGSDYPVTAKYSAYEWYEEDEE